MSGFLVAAALTPTLPLAAGAAAALRRSPRGVVAVTALGAAAAVTTLVGTAVDPDPLRDGFTLGEGTRFAVGIGADRVGATIAVLTLVVGLVVLATGSRSFEGDRRATRFAALGAALIGAVALTATGTTLLTLALGWIGTSAALTGLLQLGEGAPARDSVRRTTRTLAAGDVALAAALVVTLATVGAVDLRDGDPAVHGAVALLLVVAGIARSALLPAHRWLPSTVAAPTPVSALLHAGVVNGVGLLVLRTTSITADSRLAMAVLGATGAATAVAASAVMLARTDAKGALAWSTAGQMGFMAVQLAVGALASALFHLVGHAMYKAALFLGVGATVRSHAEHRHLPAVTAPMARTPRLLVSAAVPAGALVVALALFTPDLSTAAGLLVVGFGWVTGRSLVDGWLRTTDRRFAGVGIAAGFVAPVAYVGAMSLFKSFVGPALPEAPAGALPAAVLVVALAALAVAVVAIACLPASVRSSLRGRAAGALVSLGSPPVPRIARAGVRPGPRRAGRPAAEPAPAALVPAPFHT